MNEAETRAELIDPKLKNSGWIEGNNCKIFREFTIAEPKIGIRSSQGLKADYVLSYKNAKLAVVEAKKSSLSASEGVAQSKLYAQKLNIRYALATNGREIYFIDMETGKEKKVDKFPAPDELYNNVFATQNEWRDKFNSEPFEDKGESIFVRYYQEIAVNKIMHAVAENKNRILLTLATGTGKTYIAFQIAWKLFKTRWNINKDGKRLPRILFLADRNILADQAFNTFSAFPEDALKRIKPEEIKKTGKVPTNGSIFFTIFQTFMSGTDEKPHFGQYPKDYFDFIIIDECHRGGANDESRWRAILDYFSPAVHLGMTATPKREKNADTYRYFGDPVYIYSLKDGINDGFLTPFKVCRIQTTLDSYIYTPDDDVIEGEVKRNHEYVREEFNRDIEIEEREKKYVKIFMNEIDQKEKTLVFGVNQDHAALLRDLINQIKTSENPDYCVRVTSNDCEIGNQHLRDFQDNDKTIPTILTTSQKLSTGVDARNVRNIVLMRSVNSMIEFKQIIGRGTRLFDGKEYFTIYDFVGAYKNFFDPQWDGEPIEDVDIYESPKEQIKSVKQSDIAGAETLLERPKKQKVKIKLAPGKEREIQYMAQTLFWDASGIPISAEQFICKLFGKLPEFFLNEQELRDIWSYPDTRKKFLEKLEHAGYGRKELEILQQLTNTQSSDLFDALEYLSYNVKPLTRAVRAKKAKNEIAKVEEFEDKQKAFLEFVLEKYVDTGIEELGQEKLPELIKLRYNTIDDGLAELGEAEQIKEVFVSFQKYLY
uniref:Type I restriction enzyme n=1 Tax=Endomicrobium trichonymphae TaxID=1408204 RepID=A0A1C9ZYN1_ENDTX|nr:type I restriction enzyme [Candidatus Endomicrobium trichonymphae]